MLPLTRCYIKTYGLDLRNRLVAIQVLTPQRPMPQESRLGGFIKQSRGLRLRISGAECSSDFKSPPWQTRRKDQCPRGVNHPFGTAQSGLSASQAEALSVFDGANRICKFQQPVQIEELAPSPSIGSWPKIHFRLSCFIRCPADWLL